jgi:hypothetical protein
MKKYQFGWSLTAVSIILVGSMLLSSCSLFGLSDENKIKKTVTAYLDNMQSGIFIYDKYVSKYAADTSFADLQFQEDVAEGLMNEGLRKIQYEIGNIEITDKGKEGTCEITILTIDFEEVISGISLFEMNEETLAEAIINQGDKSEFVLSLTVAYDSIDKAWKVADTKPLAEILGIPYTEIMFVPDPLDTVELICEAMKTATYSSLVEMSVISSSQNYIEEAVLQDEYSEINEAKLEKITEELFVEMYNTSEYEISGEPIGEGYDVQIPITVHMPDISQIQRELYEDVDFLARMAKPTLLHIVQEIEAYEDDLVQERQYLADEIIVQMNDENVPRIVVESVMWLTFDNETRQWNLDEWVEQDAFDQIQFEFSILTEDMFKESYTLATQMLYDEGSINKATRDRLVVLIEDYSEE